MRGGLGWKYRNEQAIQPTKPLCAWNKYIKISKANTHSHTHTLTLIVYIVLYWSWFVHCIRNYYYYTKNDNKLFRSNEMVNTLHLHYRHHLSCIRSVALSFVWSFSFLFSVCTYFTALHSRRVVFRTYINSLTCMMCVCVCVCCDSSISCMYTTGSKYVRLIVDQWSKLVVIF